MGMSAVVRHTVARHTVALLSVLSVLLSGSTSWANDIAVSSMSLGGQNTTSDFTMVRFNLSWDNSWRFDTGPANWDAAWVFVKFRVGGSNPTFTGVTSSGTTVTVSSTANLRVGMPVRVTAGTGAFATNTVISSITNATQFVVSATPTTVLSNASIECTRIWEHAWLNNTGHIAPTGSTIDAGLQTPSQTFNASTNPALGVFVYRSAVSVGHNAFNNVQLRWNYGANGVADDAVISVQVFAIEMVYVPGGVNFNVGGGGGSSISTLPFTSTTINTGNAVTAPTGTGSLGGQAGGYPTGQTAPANASWPNGYNAFYCMKYEISQGQYRDFLNTLTRTQQDTRTQTSLVVGTTSVTNRYVMSNAPSRQNRNGIRCDATIDANQPITFYCDFNGNGTPNEATDGEWIACNHVNWMDGCAYMQWSGLRPKTELEFEKACRGNQPAVNLEFAWGTAEVVGSANEYTLGNAGAPNEGIATNYSTTVGNSINYLNDGSIGGPLRVGIFAANGSNTGRVSSGATYYGIMEMSGNLWEHAVTIGNAIGRAYTGVHGSGMLSATGNASAANWPGLTSGEVTGADGSGVRGGSWITSFIEHSYVSDRNNAALPITNRLHSLTFRGVRTAP